MSIIYFVLFINLLNAPRADVSLSNEVDNRPSVIGAIYFMETWKEVVGFENSHRISSYGNIISLDRYVYRGNDKKPLFIKGQLLKKTINMHGYETIALLRAKTYFIHRIVALAFIHNPENKPEINHIDNNPLNNNVNNLEWATKSENILHSFKCGLASNIGERNPNSILTCSDVYDIRLMIDKKITMQIIALKYNVSISTIKRIKYKQLWKTV